MKNELLTSPMSPQLAGLVADSWHIQNYTKETAKLSVVVWTHALALERREFRISGHPGLWSGTHLKVEDEVQSAE